MGRAARDWPALIEVEAPIFYCVQINWTNIYSVGFTAWRRRRTDDVGSPCPADELFKHQSSGPLYAVYRLSRRQAASKLIIFSHIWRRLLKIFLHLVVAWLREVVSLLKESRRRRVASVDVHQAQDAGNLPEYNDNDGRASSSFRRRAS